MRGSFWDFVVGRVELRISYLHLELQTYGFDVFWLRVLCLAYTLFTTPLSIAKQTIFLKSYSGYAG